jgi:hypothetical protein
MIDEQPTNEASSIISVIFAPNFNADHRKGGKRANIEHDNHLEIL